MCGFNYHEKKENNGEKSYKDMNREELKLKKMKYFFDLKQKMYESFLPQ